MKKYTAILCLVFLTVPASAFSFNYATNWKGNFIKLESGRDHRFAWSGCSAPDGSQSYRDAEWAATVWRDDPGSNVRTVPWFYNCASTNLFIDDPDKSHMYYVNMGDGVGTHWKHRTWFGTGSVTTGCTAVIDPNKLPDQGEDMCSERAVTTDPSVPGTFNRRSVMIHEVGHCIGLAHTQSTRVSVMRTRDRQTGQYCNLDTQESITWTHPDDVGGARLGYGSGAVVNDVSVMPYYNDGGDVRTTDPDVLNPVFSVPRYCPGDTMLPTPFGIANRGNTKLRYHRQLVSADNRELTSNPHSISMLLNRVKSPGVVGGIFYATWSGVTLGASALPSTSSGHRWLGMKLTNVKDASTGNAVTQWHQIDDGTYAGENPNPGLGDYARIRRDPNC